MIKTSKQYNFPVVKQGSLYYCYGFANKVKLPPICATTAEEALNKTVLRVLKVKLARSPTPAAIYYNNGELYYANLVLKANPTMDDSDGVKLTIPQLSGFYYKYF